MKRSLELTLLGGPQYYNFGEFYLDTVERRLYRNNKRIDLTPKVFDVLQALVENAGEIVSKDDFLSYVWGESFVEEGNLAVYISKLRKLLASEDDTPTITTESGVGYRFVRRVQTISPDKWVELLETTLAQRVEGKQRFTSIAIMPFKNETGDPDNEYLAEGITENLINTLSQTTDLRVIARNSVFRFKDDVGDLEKIGRKLRVSTVLAGRIQLVGSRLVISADLAKVSNGSHLWGTRLNEETDVLDGIDERVADSISRELIGLGIFAVPDPLPLFAIPAIQNSEAAKLSLRGRYLARKGGLRNLLIAIENLKRSLVIHPTDVESLVTLADCYFWNNAYDNCSLEEVRLHAYELIVRAEQLSRDSYQVHWIKGKSATYLEWDFPLALALFEKSLSTHPNFIPCLSSYSVLLSNLGRFESACRAAISIVKLDPLSNFGIHSLARIFYKSSMFETALQVLEESEDLEPLNYTTKALKASCLVEMGRFEEFYKEIEAAQKIEMSVELKALLGYGLAKNGKFRQAKEVALELLQPTEKSVPFNYYASYIYSELDQLDKAFRLLEKTIESQHVDIVSIKVDPRFRNLRRDPRFEDVLERVGITKDGRVV
ncbi:MAG: winged helix-turn-helix domain-containing protein [Pyrinomonadaceae bacterium]